MKVPRIVNRGRIAPSSPKPIIDSGRTSWSSASAVSTIDTKSPEPRLLNEVAEKLQESVPVSSTTKIMIAVCVVAVFFIICGIIIGTAVPLTLFKPSSVSSSTTVISNIIENTTKFK